MNCMFCAPWGQDEPNCGHGMENGQHMPRKWFTRSYVAGVELGRRASKRIDGENHPVADRRYEALGVAAR